MPALDEILTANVILPSQFYDARGRCIEESIPVRRLMHAILRDALGCVAGRTGKKGLGAHRASQDAIDWIEDTNDSEIFSFNSVCDSLHVDPDAGRASLRIWRSSGRRLTGRSPVKGEGEILPARSSRPRISILNRSGI
jgi:hypothetical protein